MTSVRNPPPPLILSESRAPSTCTRLASLEGRQRFLAFAALPFFERWCAPMTKHTFKAYDRHGFLVASTWTRAPGAYAAECATFQARLNRGELMRVDIWSSDPREPMRRLRPRERPQLSVVK